MPITKKVPAVSLLIAMISQTALALDSPSPEQIAALQNAEKSPGLDVRLLKREGRITEWVTLLGYASDTKETSDLVSLGKVVKMTLKADPSCIVGAECESLGNSLNHVKEHAGKHRGNLEIQDLEGTGVLHISKRRIQTVDKILRVTSGVSGMIAVGSAARSYADVSFSPEPFPDSIPSVPSSSSDHRIRKSFHGCKGPYPRDNPPPIMLSCVLESFTREATTLLQGQRQYHESIYDDLVTQAQGTIENLVYYGGVTLISATACVLSQASQAALQWICPSAASNMPTDVTSAIIDTFHRRQMPQIIALVDRRDFSFIENKLVRDFHFIPVDLQPLSAESTSNRPGPSNAEE